MSLQDLEKLVKESEEIRNGDLSSMLGKKEEEPNLVTCFRCGIEEEGEERTVGDETYYLCDICYDDMH